MKTNNYQNNENLHIFKFPVYNFKSMTADQIDFINFELKKQHNVVNFSIKFLFIWIILLIIWLIVGISISFTSSTPTIICSILFAIASFCIFISGIVGSVRANAILSRIDYRFQSIISIYLIGYFIFILQFVAASKAKKLVNELEKQINLQ